MAGIGIAFGTRNVDPEDEDTHQFSIPVDDRLDPGARRTNQHAELLVALEGLRKICDFDEERMADNSETREQHDWYLPPLEVIVTTGSEYIIKRMSEWLPNWKVVGARDTCFVLCSGHFDMPMHLHCFLIQSNGLRKSNSKRLSNLDLFLKLDTEVQARERRHDCKVKFWHVGRTYNTIADQLAKMVCALPLAMSMELSRSVSAYSDSWWCRTEGPGEWIEVAGDPDALVLSQCSSDGEEAGVFKLAIRNTTYTKPSKSKLSGTLDIFL